MSVLFFSCLALNANDQKKGLYILEVKNENFFNILDSILNKESRCEYYNKKLIYSIGLESQNGVLKLRIGSIGYDLVNSKAQLGLFKYRDHLFIVSGKELIYSIFKKTDKKKEIDYYSTEEDQIDLSTNDNFSFWIYNYSNDKFELDNSFENCN
jgi:hypothetical protein